MATYQPGTGGSGSTGSALLLENWQKQIEDAVYEDAQAYPVSAPRDRLYKKLHVRKLSTFTPRTLAGTDAGYGAPPTYDANTEVEVTFTPVAKYLALSISLSQIAQMDQDPRAPWKRNIEQAMGQAIDQDFLANASSLVTNVYGNGARSIDKAFMLGGIAALRNSAKSFWSIGNPAYFHYIPLQADDVLSIPEISSANLRGDTENPNVRGVLHEGWGLRLVVTGNVQVDGSSVAHNLLWLPSAIGISFNQRPNVFAQSFELAERLYVYANYGTQIVWDERAADMRTTSAA